MNHIYSYYEFYSKSGNTHGFVIEDVLDLTDMTVSENSDTEQR